MKIKQLGNGGAFDFNQTNSSFLIETDKVILFDCGYNVFSHLMNFEKDYIGEIDYVYISHMDDDHMGSLKTLIYYRYFILGLKTIIVAGLEIVRNALRDYLRGMENIYQGGEVINVYMFNVTGVNDLDSTQYTYDELRVNHGGTPSAGLMIKHTKLKKCLVITGDTKATSKIEKQVIKFSPTEAIDALPYDITIYHDFSHWDAPSKQVHTCNTDFEEEYSEEFKANVVKYHTGDEFNQEWIEI